MVSNPMQKKARNSFLLGVVTTLIICLIIGAVLYFMLILPQTKNNEERGEEVIAYVLKQDVKSNDRITSDMFEGITVYSNMVPSNYINSEQIAALNSQEIIAKIDMKQKTILTANAIQRSEQKTTDDLRYTEYNMLSIPTNLTQGDVVDIRITFPNGLDLIVVSKKQVKSLIGNTLGFELPEQDILMMESAIVEAYIMTASKLYVTKYVEPGNQASALETYTPTQEVQTLIKGDNNNIQEEARNALQDRFSGTIRNAINSDRVPYIIEQKENLETRLQEEIENARAAREAYLSGLTSY